MSFRVGFLQQNAYNATDTYVPIAKQYKMLKVILYLYDKCRDFVVNQAIPLTEIQKTGIFDKIIKIKYDIENDKLEKFDSVFAEIDALQF